MPRRRSNETPLPAGATSGALEFLRALAGEEMFQAAMPLLRRRLALTPEKVALLAFRVLAPDAVPDKGEEAILRDLDPSTLKKYKDAHALPERMGFRETRNLIA